jgi:acyl-homoserine lactone acylase PvdQ
MTHRTGPGARTRRRLLLVGLAALLVPGGLLATSGGGRPAGAAASCATKKGPVGAPFTDCSFGNTLNIVPPGSTGLYNATDFASFELNGTRPAHTDDQESMYANLVDVAPNLQPSQLGSYYKDSEFYAKVQPGDTVETVLNHPGTAIIRDARFGVPHIFGNTRYDTEFGSGYASAEDRLFMMDVLRHYGRGQLSSFVGPSPSTLAMDCGIDAVAGYSETELQAMVDALPTEFSKKITVGGQTLTEGQQIVNDAQAYVDGVNAYIQAALLDPTKLPVEYPALQILPAPWKTTDIVATATLVQAIFAIGGGNEVQSALLYQQLVNRYGQAKGAAIWSDFRSQNDPEAQVSIPTSFPYEQVPASVDPNSVAMPTAPPTTSMCDGGPLPAPNTGLGQIVVGPVTIDLSNLVPSSTPHSSNELIVTAAHSATGHPIAVFGPQTGYFAPEILHEIELHGPGLQARGVSFPGTEVFVELGRGVDYAWSATSAGADIIDQRIERLCNQDGTPASLSSTAYVYKGSCVPMYERTDRQVAKTTASATNPPAVVTIQIERTVHGPVIGRTTAIDPATGHPVPVAVSVERSTFNDELSAAPAFLEWNDPDIIHGPTDFQRAAGEETGTFNWTYVDATHVAYYMAGRLPIRNPNVNPNFPVWGTGQWDWAPNQWEPGDLSASDPHPRIVDPASGFFANWNNKPAPDFSASDSQFAYGPVYRVQSLADRIQAVISQRLATPTDIVNAMEDGGTVDLDGAQLVGPLATVLSGAPLTAAQSQVLSILQAWVQDPAWAPSTIPGAHRRDRSGSGSYEQGNAVAIMDNLYPRLAHAIFDPWLSSAQFAILQGINGLNNPPGPVGSAYDGGWEGYLQRALRQAANPAIANPYSQNYCGSGVLADCQAALQSALQATIDSLTSAYGTADPTRWTCSRSNSGSGQCNPGNDDIRFSAVGVGTVPNMPWVNRPTFQQVVSYQDQRN